jgi:hypothetical protein
MALPPTLDELFIAASPEAWREAGFRVDGDLCEVGSVRLRLEGNGERRGITRWSVRDLTTQELDGLETAVSDSPPAHGGPHDNGVVSIDHVVVISPDLDRTATTLKQAGFDFRRVREGETPGGSTRQAFFRMAEVILEIVEAPEGTRIASDPDGPARLWGISFLVDDMDAPAAVLGGALGVPRDAVQPGRLIATLGKEASLGPAIAFMTPGPGAA